MPVARHSCPDEVFGRALLLWICLVSPLLCLLACIVWPPISGKQTFCSVCFHHGNPYWHELLYRLEAPGQGCATLWPASSLRIGVSASWTRPQLWFCSWGRSYQIYFNMFRWAAMFSFVQQWMQWFRSVFASHYVRLLCTLSFTHTTFNPYHCTIYHFTQTQPHNKLNTSGTFLQ